MRLRPQPCLPLRPRPCGPGPALHTWCTVSLGPGVLCGPSALGAFHTLLGACSNWGEPAPVSVHGARGPLCSLASPYMRLLPGPLPRFLCPERWVAPRVLAACTAALPPNGGHLWGKPVEQRETAGTPRSQPTGPLFPGLRESLPRCWPHNSRGRATLGSGLGGERGKTPRNALPLGLSSGLISSPPRTVASQRAQA